MLSIKSSLCSVVLLASSATAQWSGTQAAGNLSVEACSKQNTGASNDQGSNIYQSLGACNDKCAGKFAYAVLQYQECWCSNEKPSETVNLESCNQNCPGYPDQNCGSKDAGLFGYVPLDGASASSSEATSTMSSSGSASSASNSTIPAMTPSSSSAKNSSMSTASENGNSTSSSDDDSASYTGDSASLPVPRSALAASAFLCLAMGYAFGFAA